MLRNLKAICTPKNFQYIRLKNTCRCFSKNSKSTNLRNIGIIAHIDAGKTTTTERMLFYAGHINLMGDVDKGNTVTDYLPVEMERGITVQSAAVSFKWNNTEINLIDTPGHVDFTVEVERSLRVLDGVVAIFDGAKGVQAQSRTVWKQANRYHVPRIAFISKMDKPNANFEMSINSLKSELGSSFLLLQIPKLKKKSFVGHIDIINMEENIWDESWTDPRKGRNFITNSINEKHEHWDEVIKVRADLIDKLDGTDEEFDQCVETWLENDGTIESFPSDVLVKAIQKATLSKMFVPVLCGSSHKNIGVQQLLDAVVNYLPPPESIKHNFLNFNTKSFTGMAFKILHDKRLGELTFVRVYSGVLKSLAEVYNVNKDKKETPSKLLKANADKFLVVNSLKAGDIGILSGLKHTYTGDTLVLTEKKNEEALKESLKSNSDAAVLPTIPIPEPVFYRTVYANSHSQEKILEKAINVISKEDPSIRFVREDDGSIVLSGMGELHVDIISERIKNEFKVDAYIGPIQVAYREVPTQTSKHSDTYETTISEQSYKVKVGVEIFPSENKSFRIKKLSDVECNLFSNSSTDAAKRGILLACNRGIILNYPIIGVGVKLKKLEVKGGCPNSLISSAVTNCVREALQKADCVLVQPMMIVEISTQAKEYIDIAQNLLAQCHAEVYDNEETYENENRFTIRAKASVSDMKGFSSQLRSITSGMVDISLNLGEYEPVPIEQLHRINNELSGRA